MKKFIWIIVIILIFGIGYVNQDALAKGIHPFLYHSPCDTPITYRIDKIDTRFNVSKEEFLAYTKTGADLWSTAIGKKLFTYDPQGEIAVSLIYDERQQLNTQINQMDSELKAQDQHLKPKIANFENRLANFNNRVSALNAEIQSWNNKGGAPPEEFERLKEEQAALQSEGQNLEAEAQRLNQSADAFNSQISDLNQTIDTFQDVLIEKPEEGVYISDKNGERIYIYFNTSKNEIIHTLAHEFGHALGIEHVNNPQAIMYTQTSEITTLAPEDIAALKRVCQEQHIADIAVERIVISIAYWREKLKNRFE